MIITARSRKTVEKSIAIIGVIFGFKIVLKGTVGNTVHVDEGALAFVG